MLRVKQFVFGPFEESTFILVDDATRKSIVVDPGMFNQDDCKVFDNFVDSHEIHLTQIVNTHLHIDHCIGNSHVCTRYGIPSAANAGDAPLGAQLPEQALRFGIRTKIAPIRDFTTLNDGDIINIGDSSMTVISVPGHSPGGIALYSECDRLLIAGDSLFRGSIGRTDLPGGDYDTLIDAVSSKLLSLPDDTNVLPGHGPLTTIGFERTHNPFLKDA